MTEMNTLGDDHNATKMTEVNINSSRRNCHYPVTKLGLQKMVAPKMVVE